MQTAEGYVSKNLNWKDGSTEKKYPYSFTVSDHLGNIRVVVDEQGQVQQKNEYTAFGVVQSTDPSKNKYLFNNKELQTGTNYLDYGARMYQPELGRWNVVDPLGEKYSSYSPYNFTSNNPINRVDPDGNSDFPINDIFINSETKQMSVIKTNDNFDRIVIDGSYKGNTSKGYAQKVWDKNGLTSNQVSINYGANADPSTVSLYTKAILIDIMNQTGNESIKINSTARSPEAQARVMSENVNLQGMSSQKQLYGVAGDKVLDSHPDINKMAIKINKLGPTNVSKHCCNPSQMNVVDVSPRASFLNNPRGFAQSASNNPNVSRVLSPYNSKDPAIHIEIPQRKNNQ
jgi:RHS repeat-associated protein